MNWLAADTLTVVTAIAGVLALPLAVFVAMFFRDRKALRYVVVTNQRFVATKRHASQRLQVTYDGEPATDVHLVGVYLRSVGTRAIAPEDFIEGPLTLCFLPVDQTKPRPRILGVEVVEPTPQSFRPKVEALEGCAQIAPAYMNRGNSFALQLVAANYEESKLTMTRRLRDVTISGTDAQRRSRVRVSIVIGAGVAWLIGLVVAAAVFPATRSGALKEPYQTVIAVFTVVCLLAQIAAGSLEIIAGRRLRRYRRIFE